LRGYIGALRKEFPRNTAPALIHPKPTCHQGNLSPSSLSEIERGLAQPCVTSLRKIIQVLRPSLFKLENLEARGSLAYPADAPVFWAIKGDEPFESILVVTPPGF
jgi:hypothetical protein